MTPLDQFRDMNTVARIMGQAPLDQFQLRAAVDYCDLALAMIRRQHTRLLGQPDLNSGSEKPNDCHPAKDDPNQYSAQVTLAEVTGLSSPSVQTNLLVPVLAESAAGVLAESHGIRSGEARGLTDPRGEQDPIGIEQVLAEFRRRYARSEGGNETKDFQSSSEGSNRK